MIPTTRCGRCGERASIWTQTPETPGPVHLDCHEAIMLLLEAADTIDATFPLSDTEARAVAMQLRTKARSRAVPA